MSPTTNKARGTLKSARARCKCLCKPRTTAAVTRTSGVCQRPKTRAAAAPSGPQSKWRASPPGPLAVAVALVHPGERALAPARAGLPLDLQVHHAVGDEADHLPEEI